MPDVFTPLTPASIASGASTSVAAPAGVFKPLPAAAAGAAVPGTPAACAGKPGITLQRKGNVVTSIRVQCSCGQVLEINCMY